MNNRPPIHLVNRREDGDIPVRESHHPVKIFSGDWHVSTKANEVLITILGSCVSACIRDPIAGIGGMNHFLLPGDESVVAQVSDAARYGVFAMESLINGILKAGGRKDRLEFKVFGGGNVINNSQKIGSKNAAFIRNFLKNEVTCRAASIISLTPAKC